MNLSVAVQHHPARAHILPDLLKALDSLNVEIVTDPDPEGQPSTWRTYRLALETTPAEATHRLVIQDDASPAPGFQERLKWAVADHPGRVLVLCVLKDPPEHAELMREAHAHGRWWVPLVLPHLPTIAVVWPVECIQPVLDAIAKRKLGEWEFRTNDDWLVGTALKALGVVPLAAIPSIVEHPDTVPSLVGSSTGTRTAAVI